MTLIDISAILVDSPFENLEVCFQKKKIEKALILQRIWMGL
jgi:hypothetical protein